LAPGILVLEEGENLWARGDALDERLEIELKKLPGERFSLVDGEPPPQLSPIQPRASQAGVPGEGDRRLRAEGSRIPRGKLPLGKWMPISEWFTLEPQTASLPGVGISKVAVRWDRSDRTVEASILITRGEHWRRWAVDAPAVRLQALRFALSEDGRVLVWGKPLPPIAGERYAEADGIAWPCGLEPRPGFDAATLREALQFDAGALALFDGGEGYELIAAEDFVPATRSAVRLSIEEARP
jgi:hypothetical protein